MLQWWFEEENSTHGWVVGNTIYYILPKPPEEETEEERKGAYLEYWPLSTENEGKQPRVFHNQRQGHRWVEYCRQRG